MGKGKKDEASKSVREKYPDIKWVAERRNNWLQWEGKDIKADEHWGTYESPQQVERAKARGGEVVDVVAEGLDVRCVGLPPGPGVKYMRFPKEVVAEQRRLKRASNRAMWDRLKRGRLAGKGRIGPIMHGGQRIDPDVSMNVSGGAARRALQDDG